MKKGFTLIELLSVIVVLAIIAVIAVPTLIGVVNKARLQSLKNSAYGLIEASNLYYAQYSNPNNVRFDIKNNIVTTTEANKLKYKGNVKDGVVIISKNGKVTVCITDGKNSAYKNYNESEVTLVSKKTCTVPVNTSVVYLDGEATMDVVDAKNILDRLDRLEDVVKSSSYKEKELDYANTVFTRSVSNYGRTTYTIPKDGVVYAVFHYNSAWSNTSSLAINGKDVYYYEGASSTGDPNASTTPMFPVKKDDTVVFIGYYDANADKLGIFFIPYK